MKQFLTFSPRVLINQTRSRPPLRLISCLASPLYFHLMLYRYEYGYEYEYGYGLSSQLRTHHIIFIFISSISPGKHETYKQPSPHEKTRRRRRRGRRKHEEINYLILTPSLNPRLLIFISLFPPLAWFSADRPHLSQHILLYRHHQLLILSQRADLFPFSPSLSCPILHLTEYGC